MILKAKDRNEKKTGASLCFVLKKNSRNLKKFVLKKLEKFKDR